MFARMDTPTFLDETTTFNCQNKITKAVYQVTLTNAMNLGQGGSFTANCDYETDPTQFNCTTPPTDVTNLCSEDHVLQATVGTCNGSNDTAVCGIYQLGTIPGGVVDDMPNPIPGFIAKAANCGSNPSFPSTSNFWLSTGMIATYCGGGAALLALVLAAYYLKRSTDNRIAEVLRSESGSPSPAPASNRWCNLFSRCNKRTSDYETLLDQNEQNQLRQ